MNNYEQMSNWRRIFADVLKKSLIAVNRITHHWIIRNQKTKKISSVYKFLQVTLSSFFYWFLIFYNTQKSKYWFTFKKSEILLF